MKVSAVVALLLSLALPGSQASNGDGRLMLAQATQTPAACMINCGTQTTSCQSTCLGLSSGTVPSSTTILGTTTDPTQCYLNCTSQQLLCDQTCPQQQ
jgi:hypothetical protein